MGIYDKCYDTQCNESRQNVIYTAYQNVYKHKPNDKHVIKSFISMVYNTNKIININKDGINCDK